MDKFITHTGLVAPLDRANVDTDAIIPKQFLKSIKRSGYGPNCFDEWRYFDVGQPGIDNSKRPLNPQFVLNEPRYQGASILIARQNFGCGSSREHAPWALQQNGYRAVIAPSFGDIFYTNSLNNGLLVIRLQDAEVDRLFHDCAAFPGFELTIDLDAQQVRSTNGSFAFFFFNAAAHAHQALCVQEHRQGLKVLPWCALREVHMNDIVVIFREGGS